MKKKKQRKYTITLTEEQLKIARLGVMRYWSLRSKEEELL